MVKGGDDRMSFNRNFVRGGVLGAILVATLAAPGLALASHRPPADPTCRCSARVSHARPSLQFNDGVVQFIPRVNISISSRGPVEAPGFTARLAYEGQTSYESDDVAVPGGVSFSGDQEVFAGSCGNKFNFSGYQLAPVSLSGLSQTLVGEDQELKGTVGLKATLSGCGAEEEHRQFEFRLREFGNIRVGGWRTVRS